MSCKSMHNGSIKISLTSLLVVAGILFLLLLSGCKAAQAAGQAKDKGAEVAGEVATAAEGAKALVQTPEEKTILGTMTSGWIIGLTTICGIASFFFGGFALYRMRPWLAGSIFASGVGIIGIPILVVVMWKAAIFLLWVFCGLVIVVVAVGIFILWRKFEDKHETAEDLVRIIALSKERLGHDTWLKLKAIADEVQGDGVSKKGVLKIREKLKL